METLIGRNRLLIAILLGVALFFCVRWFGTQAQWLVIIAISSIIALYWGYEYRVCTQVKQLTTTLRELSSEQQAHTASLGQEPLAELMWAWEQFQQYQKKKESKLLAEREFLLTLFGEMADGVIIIDHQGKIGLVNDSARTLFHVPTQEGRGMSIAEFVRQHQIIELWKKAAETRQQQATLVDLLHGGVFLQIAVTPIKITEQYSFLMILRDLTSIRRLETVRRDFISNISHELRTPLASLRAVVETLQDGALDDPPAAQRFLQRADIELDSLTQIVEELLELSRIESGQVPFRFAECSIAPIVAHCIERLQSQIERNGLQVRMEVSADLPLVMIDAPRIERVLTNLLHNAIKFTPQGGMITVSAAVHNTEALRVEVIDNGIGIGSADLPRIFERFFKSDRARTRSGTGLGLAIVKHTIQSHGGHVGVESKLGKGSRFYFTLPLA